MSTITRRRRASRINLDPYRRYELLTGEIRYPPPQYYTGYGNGTGTDLAAFISDEMREDWKNHRDELIAFWQSGEFTDGLPWLFACGGPGELPWAAKQFA